MPTGASCTVATQDICNKILLTYGDSWTAGFHPSSVPVAVCVISSASFFVDMSIAYQRIIFSKYFRTG